MDAGTLAALGREVVYVQWFAWLDFLDDPLRAVSGVQDVTIGASETGDPDLDGYTFLAIPSELIGVSDVQHSQSGSETVTVSLSALPLDNAEILDLIGNRPRWRKREARMWFRLLDPILNGNGKITGFTPLPLHPYYSGYIIDMPIEPGPDEQKVTVLIENYQAALSEASGLTYLHQSEFDPDDHSAEQTLAAANGMQKAGVAGGFGGSGGGGSRGGGGPFNRDTVEF